MPTFRRSFLWWLVLAACGPEGKVIVASGPSTGSDYPAVCSRWAARNKTELQKGDRQPGQLRPLQPDGGLGAAVAEAELVKLYSDGGPRRAALYARGGLGKTKLAEGLRAELCGTLPVVLVPAQAVLASGNWLTAASGQTPDIAATVAAHNGRLLVLADAIDEVALSERDKVLAATDNLPHELPKAQVLFLARPPVLQADYGIAALDARWVIPELECAQVDALVAKALPGDDQRKPFEHFARRYGLDFKQEEPTACRYPYLASYRDVAKVLEFYKQATDPNSTLLVSLAHAHEALAVERLGKELAALGMDGRAAMALLDKMTAAAMQLQLSGSVAVAMDDCTKAGASAEACEKIFQSALFEPAGAGKVRYSAPGLGDLFAARWLEMQIATALPNCAVALKYPQLLQRGDVFAYLMGQPKAPECAMPLVDDRCSRNPKSDQIEVLDQGLPAGKARAQIIKRMHDGYEASHWKYCTQKTLKSLDASLGTY